MMGWFKKKSKKVPYIPQGRVGYLRKQLGGRDFEFTVIFEEIGRIGQRSKTRILEIDVDRDCNKTEKQCITRWGIGDWLTTENIHWESDRQRAERLGQTIPVTYDMDEEELEEEIQYTLTPHTFTQ
jgi:hypothetical protein